MVFQLSDNQRYIYIAAIQGQIPVPAKEEEKKEKTRTGSIAALGKIERLQEVWSPNSTSCIARLRLANLAQQCDVPYLTPSLRYSEIQRKKHIYPSS
jgi:hypothetical protein